MIIMGIDPGSRFTGVGVIQKQGQTLRYVASAVIAVRGDTLADKMRCVYDGIARYYDEHHPEEAAIEQVFMHDNARSALLLGHARGVAMVAMANEGIRIAEYSARQVKKSVAGYGAADKDQVIHMVQRLLALRVPLKSDEADALAVAICHALHGSTQCKIAGHSLAFRRGRMR